jgi:hypothetical protein
MNAIISKLLNRASDLADVEPTIALFLAAALLAVFLTALFQSDPAAEIGEKNPSLLWTLYRSVKRWLWALLLVMLFTGTISVVRSYPCIAGLDNDRQALYLNLCALQFLSFTAWLLVKCLGEKVPSREVMVMKPAV